MNVDTMNWPQWLQQVIWFRHVCPRCKSIEFKPAELRVFDGMLGLLALRPVRCKGCWRRFYWVSVRDPE